MHTVESNIVAVTLFRRGAVVTRRARVARGEDGFPEVVRFDGLPLCLDEGSVRVEVDRAEEGAHPYAADVGLSLTRPESDPSLEPADDPQEDAATLAVSVAARQCDELRSVVGQLERLELRRRQGPEEGKPAASSPTTARLAWIEFRATQLEMAQAELWEAEQRHRVAQEGLEALLEARRTRTSARNPRDEELRRAATVRFANTHDVTQPVYVQLSYRVPGARWAPAYALRVDATSRARLELRAVVAQNTGEDWAAAALTVSTALPQRWTELPDLKALRVGRRQNTPGRPGWRSAPPDIDGLFADYDRDFARAQRQVDTSLRQLVESGAVAGQKTPPPPVRRAMAKKRAGPGSPRSPVAGDALAPMATSMPAPAAAMAPAAAAPGSAGGAAFGERLEETEAAFDKELASDDGSEGVAAEPPEVRLGRGLLDYGRLHLAGPRSARRGRLQPADPHEASGGRGSDASKVDEARRRAESVAHRALPAGHRWAEVEPGFDFAYVCDGAVDVPSDSAAHVVAILGASAELTRRYVCVPAVAADVFRVVAARNPLDAPLPAGPIDVYVDGMFALTSSLDATAPGGRIELGLGVEQAIKVARNVAFEENTSGLLKRQHEFEHTVQVDVQNLLDEPVELELRERVPVRARPDDETIEVEEVEVSPSWDTYEPEAEALEGGRRWRVRVDATARERLVAKWVVRVPSGFELVGGNRRER